MNNTMTDKRPARLLLEDGSGFCGYAFGAETPVAGEVVFNTGMVGYPESMTDRSYRGQILVLTYPLIGNYGVPEEVLEEGLSRHFESEGIQVLGLVVADYSFKYSHWSAKRSLEDWMIEHNIPGIYGIDTRELTKQLREQGTLPGKIIYETDDIEFDEPHERNLVKEVSVAEPIEYKRGDQRVILVDCGVKNNIIRAFTRRGISVLRCPWDYDFSKEKADGLVVSNGPGDPKMCPETVENVRRAMSRNMPILGICLGSQILALASGADTYK
ncbi:MAG: carbamoyl phosphate synthase small subunit, partial [Candidatus Coatesbacteria bacterium]|nr:carbamoyl phosphate synthase small subunit [Candidatus Coatesbacteria bacterium]